MTQQNQPQTDPPPKPVTAEPGLRERTVANARVTYDRIAADARGSIAVRVVADLFRAEIADRSMTLAAQAFTSILPVLIAVSSFGSHEAVDDIASWVGLVPFGAQIESYADTTTPSAATFGVVGLLMIVISATSFARALGRMYGRCWDVPVAKMKQAWRWVMVLFVVIVAIVLLAAAHLAARLPIGGHVLDYALGFVIWTVLWAYLPHLLTGGRLPLRILLIIGALTAVGLSLLRFGGAVAMPRASASAMSQFGILGLVFTMIGWLFVFAVIVVGSNVVISSLARDATVGPWLRSPLELRH
ncbi:MAG TPA: hypothetical protein VIW24_32160 [Aldersonia sp.]